MGHIKYAQIGKVVPSLSPQLDGFHGLVELRLHSLGKIDVDVLVRNPRLQVVELNTGISSSAGIAELRMGEL